ncbi:uncharacterized protein JCM15063_001437 [Sporobolomyces koalae]|uniref:uncharacterized protein n=1 Tax=Sporobolomyces koalae TaxID=500713 RepID=UPI0031814023
MTTPTWTRRNPLSTAQESRLIRHLDPALLDLAGAFESRHSPTSVVPTLPSFLDRLEPLLSLVLSIPAAKPSGHLRVAYLLQLMGHLAPAIEGYPLSNTHDDTCHLFDTLDRFDHGCTAVLLGDELGPSRSNDKESSTKGSFEVEQLTNTELVRLKSLVRHVRQTLDSRLRRPQLVPLAVNPFEERLEIDVRTRFGPVSDDLEGTPELSMGEESTTEDEAMSVDTIETVRPGFGSGSDPDSDSDNDEFEAVEIRSPSPPRSRSGDNAAAFEIQFDSVVPLPAMHGSNPDSDQTPIVTQARGFDPDEEYPPDSDDEENRDEGGTATTTKAVEEKLDAVFAKSRAILEQLERQRDDS